METALNRPPEWAERLVSFLTPPGAREAVVGDLSETYSSLSRYALEALRTVPFVVVSQMRRNTNIPTLLLQGFLVFFCLGGWAGHDGQLDRSRVILPAIAILGLLLRDAYQATQRPSSRRAIIEAIAIPYGLLFFSQVMTLGIAIVRQMGPDLPLWLRVSVLAPMLLPLLGMLRTGLIVRGDGQGALPHEKLSADDLSRDYRRFEHCVRRRNRIEAGALGLAAILAAAFLRSYMPAAIGLALMAVYAFVALYLLFEGGARILPAGADFLSLCALYQRELARQQQLRRFLLWLWLTPVLILLHAKLTDAGFSASRSGTVTLGGMAAILLCFFISALNREYGGWIQEKIGLLDRMPEEIA